MIIVVITLASKYEYAQINKKKLICAQCANMHNRTCKNINISILKNGQICKNENV